MALSFSRVGNAPRFVFQISNTKFQTEQSRPAGHVVKRANANRVRNMLQRTRVLTNSATGCREPGLDPIL